MNVSSGNSGIAILAADLRNLVAFISGLKMTIGPDSCRYAFMPSKISWE